MHVKWDIRRKFRALRGGKRKNGFKIGIFHGNQKGDGLYSLMYEKIICKFWHLEEEYQKISYQSVIFFVKFLQIKKIKIKRADFLNEN